MSKNDFYVALYSVVALLFCILLLLKSINHVDPDDKELQNFVKEMNSYTPTKYGGLGILDSVSLNKEYLTLHFALIGDSTRMNFLKKNYEEQSSLIKYIVLSEMPKMESIIINLNGTNRNILCRFYSNDGSEVEWKFSGNELNVFIDTISTSKKEIIKAFKLDLASREIYLPITKEDIQNPNRLTLLEDVFEKIDTNTLLQSVICTDTEVIFTFEVSDNILETIRKNGSSKEIRRAIIKDNPSILSYAEADLDLTFKYIGERSRKEVLITHTYQEIQEILLQ